nr:hypothetical protein CFP56_46732 [Quercus suber]
MCSSAHFPTAVTKSRDENNSAVICWVLDQPPHSMGRSQPKAVMAQVNDTTLDVEETDEESLQSGEDLSDEEFHTEDEDDEEAVDGSESNDEDEDNDDEADGLEHVIADQTTTSAPLLPSHLLQPESAIEHAVLEAAILTRKQRRAQSAKDRKAKRQLYAQIRRDARGSGVLEAGAAARIRRGLALGADKVASGRIQKKKSSQPSQVIQSGRQQLLNKRKREERKREEIPLVMKKRQKTGSKR